MSNSQDCEPIVQYPIRLRSRLFSKEDIELINRIIETNYPKGRTQISKEICIVFNWRQPNGWLKDRACRDVLLSLENMKLITLPKPLVHERNHLKNQRVQEKARNVIKISPDMICAVPDFRLEFAKSNGAETTWNQLVDAYHYLGHKVTVGRCIKYLVWMDNSIIGALAFSSASWRIAARDNILKSIGITNENIRDVVINNSRFLILPNVTVKNLASRILAEATRQIVLDWNSYYALTPVVSETFVQPSLFRGTCYKAANWIEIGTTKGFAKRGSSYITSTEPKKIFLYGLNTQIRKKIAEVSANIPKGNDAT